MKRIIFIIFLLNFGLFCYNNYEKFSYKNNKYNYNYEEKIIYEPKIEEKQDFDIEQKITTSLGIYRITAYCGCFSCNGKYNNLTASGTYAQADRTVAAPNSFPFGTKLLINNKEYIVEDRGGAIVDNKLDIYFNSHQEALDFEVKYIEVFLIK